MKRESCNDCLHQLEHVLGESFCDRKVLEKAITHSSFEGGGPAAGMNAWSFSEMLFSS